MSDIIFEPAREITKEVLLLPRSLAGHQESFVRQLVYRLDGDANAYGVPVQGGYCCMILHVKSGQTPSDVFVSAHI